MQAAARAVEPHPWSRRPDPTYFPVSKVLRDRRLVTFDSDDEDADNDDLPPSKFGEKAMDVNPSNAPSEVAYVTEGRVESVQFDLTSEELSRALRALPRDTWTTLLNDADRQKLMRYLPNLEGWNGASGDEAQRVNIEALLDGDNFHFGYPVANIERSLGAGSLTEQATATREAQRQVEFDQLDHRRLIVTRTRLQELKRRCGEKDKNDSHEAWKKIRLSSDDGFIHSESSTAGLVTEEGSIFLAIRGILATEKLTAKQVAERLQRDYSTLCSSVGGPPLFIAFDRYIEAALAFLGVSEGSSGQNHHWSSAHFIENGADGLYAWDNGQDDQVQDEETRVLLLLEQVFRAPVSSSFIDSASRSSAVIATRKRREQILTRRALDALEVHAPTFTSPQELGSTSSLLKRAMVTRDPGQHTFDKSQFHEQERQRYSHGHQAFVYTDTRSDERWTVGPTFERQPTQLDRLSETLLTPDVFHGVNLLSLVYDACACLTGGVGSRADIRSNLTRSQFIKSDASKTTIDEATTVALDILEAQPPRQASTPCVRFDPEGLCWRYVHAANEWSAVAADPEAEPTAKPLTPSKMSMKDLLH